MIYKVVMSNGPEVAIESEEALQKFLEEANSGKKLVLTKYGVINTSFIVSVVRHKEKMEEVREQLGYGKKPHEAETEVLGPSPFAKLLVDRMTMLSPRSRTEAQEESAKR